MQKLEGKSKENPKTVKKWGKKGFSIRKYFVGWGEQFEVNQRYVIFKQ
jgi:hypothetical protein